MEPLPPASIWASHRRRVRVLNDVAFFSCSNAPAKPTAVRHRLYRPHHPLGPSQEAQQPEECLAICRHFHPCEEALNLGDYQVLWRIGWIWLWILQTKTSERQKPLQLITCVLRYSYKLLAKVVENFSYCMLKILTISSFSIISWMQPQSHGSDTDWSHERCLVWMVSAGSYLWIFLMPTGACRHIYAENLRQIHSCWAIF